MLPLFFCLHVFGCQAVLDIQNCTGMELNPKACFYTFKRDWYHIWVWFRENLSLTAMAFNYLRQLRVWSCQKQTEAFVSLWDFEEKQVSKSSGNNAKISQGKWPKTYWSFFLCLWTLFLQQQKRLCTVGIMTICLVCDFLFCYFSCWYKVPFNGIC